MSFAEVKLALEHLTRRVTSTVPMHGAKLAINPVTGQDAQLILANPSAGATQTINGSLIVDNLITTGSTQDVTAYGAVGDGVTDDTVAIQDAIDAAALSGGIVFFPPGIFKITASLNMTRNSDGFFPVKLQGSGSSPTGGSIIKTTGSIDILKITNTGTQPAFIKGWEVSELCFNGGERQIYTSYASNGSIYNCTFVGPLTGSPVACVDIHTSANLDIAENSFNTLAGRIALKDTDSSALNIRDNRFGENLATCIWLIRTTNSTVVNNLLDEFTSTGIFLDDARFVSVTGNEVNSGTGPTVAIKATQTTADQNLSITGNVIRLTASDAGDIGVMFTGTKYSVVTANVISAKTSFSTTANAYNCAESKVFGNTMPAFVAGTFGVFSIANSTYPQIGSNTSNPPRIITTATDTLSKFDSMIFCNRAGTITITLPHSPWTGQILNIKDISGAASSNPITVTPNSGTIEGLASYPLNGDYDSIEIVYNGTEWSVI